MSRQKSLAHVTVIGFSDQGCLVCNNVLNRLTNIIYLFAVINFICRLVITSWWYSSNLQYCMQSSVPNNILIQCLLRVRHRCRRENVTSTSFGKKLRLSAGTGDRRFPPWEFGNDKLCDCFFSMQQFWKHYLCGYTEKSAEHSGSCLVLAAKSCETPASVLFFHINYSI